MWDKPAVLTWIANFLFAFSVVLAMYALVFVVVHLPIFPIRQVIVDGELSHVTREQVNLIVAKHLKGNFFTLDLPEARDAFEKLPWARKVSVRKRWPDRLEVAIEEHRALARWGDLALVNTHGELFHAATDAELPVFYGPGNGVKEVTENYAIYRQTLKKADIDVASVTVSGRRSWEIKTNKGMMIALGRAHMLERLSMFVSAYHATIGGLNVPISYVDLRYSNGFAVRKPEIVAKKESAPVKPTTVKG